MGDVGIGGSGEFITAPNGDGDGDGRAELMLLCLDDADDDDDDGDDDDGEGMRTTRSLSDFFVVTLSSSARTSSLSLLLCKPGIGIPIRGVILLAKYYDVLKNSRE